MELQCLEYFVVVSTGDPAISRIPTIVERVARCRATRAYQLFGLCRARLMASEKGI